jgi:hypothetical protein
MADKPLRVVVRGGGSSSNLYRWEIYRGPDRVERSLHRYPDEHAAREAGMQVMAKLIIAKQRQRPVFRGRG